MPKPVESNCFVCQAQDADNSCTIFCLSSDTFPTVDIGNKHDIFSTAEAESSLYLTLQKGKCQFPFSSFLFGKKSVSKKQKPCVRISSLYTSHFNFRLKSLFASQESKQQEGWFQLALDIRASEDWIYIVCWFHGTSSETQQYQKVTTAQKIVTPFESGFVENYPDDVLLSREGAEKTSEPILLVSTSK